MSNTRVTEFGSPLVTIAMSIYNGREYLRKSVESMLAQSLNEWELIVIDDGSWDDAIHIIDDIYDPRIKVVRDGQNKGLAARLNEALDLAKGKFFARMDQDDISYPERLAKQIEFLKQNPDVDLCGVRCIAINEFDEPIGELPFALTHEKICKHPWNGFYLSHPSWCGKTSWFRTHRYAYPGPYFCEDQEMLLRTYASSRFDCVDEILLAYRVNRRESLLKKIRTRQALLIVKIRIFLKSKYYMLILLAVAVTLINVSVDVIENQLNRFLDGSLNRRRFRSISKHDCHDWRLNQAITKKRLEKHSFYSHFNRSICSG